LSAGFGECGFNTSVTALVATNISNIISGPAPSATQNQPGDWGFWMIFVPIWQWGFWAAAMRLNLIRRNDERRGSLSDDAL
jgi:hypothetical protein